MTPLKNYLQDGANHQARAVMAMLQTEIEFEGAQPWEVPQIARWQNCREQGYVVTLRMPQKTLQIAWFEHRNSDSICAIRWAQTCTNSPTIETADFKGQCYKDKYDVSFQVGYGEILKMAQWIENELVSFWAEQKPTVSAK